MMSVYRILISNYRSNQAYFGIRTAYADPPATVAMIVDRTCSLTVNGPGFRGNPKTDTFGMKRAHRRPTGKESS